MQNFSTDVIERSYNIPVVVDFWAEWCAPCRMLGPVLERLAAKNSDKWLLVKLDTEQFPELASQYGVQGIPNVKLFVDGEVAAEFEGALPEEGIVKWLNDSLPGPYRKQLQEAQQLLLEGKLRKAQKLLHKIIKAEPQNHLALILLASSYLYADHQKAIELVSPIREDSEQFDMAESIRTLGKLFQLRKQPDTLPESSMKAVYLDAIDNLRAQKFGQALEKFIDVIRVKRAYDDEGARKACIAIFKFLGENHEITQKYRREFSSALYA